MNTKLLLVIAIMALVGIVSAIPTTGVGFDISSNNFTVPVVGSTGDVWIAWGQAEDAFPWASGYYSADGDLVVFGAPIIGGKTVYYKACDNTGCGAVRSLTILAVTTMPTPTFGIPYTNLTKSHMKITEVPQIILPGYMATGVTASIVWGIMFFFIFVGYWFRTRSVRLPIVLGLLMVTFIVSPSFGLFMGFPVIFQYGAQALMAIGIAGIFLGFIK